MTEPGGMTRRQVLKYAGLMGMVVAGSGHAAAAANPPAGLLPLTFAAVGPVPDFFHYQVATPLNMWKGVGLQNPPGYVEFPAGGAMIAAAVAHQWSIGDIGGPPVITANTKFPLYVLAAWDAADVIEFWLKPNDAATFEG
ncbi:MAG: hypothetical protein ACREDL_23675, partial [Bradyrhizobium sp.]